MGNRTNVGKVTIPRGNSKGKGGAQEGGRLRKGKGGERER